MIFGIDVSQYQPVIDWRKVAASGIRFAFVKASEVGADPFFLKHITGARGVIDVLGAYHFLRPGNGAAQADTYLATIGDPAKLDHLIVDVERTAGGDPSYADAVAFVERVKARTGRPVLVYTGYYWWREHTGDANGAALGALWLSWYPSKSYGSPEALYAGVPADLWSKRFGGWTGPSVLQFSSTGKVPGIPASLDVNAFRGTVEQLRALGGAKESDMRFVSASGYSTTSAKRLRVPKGTPLSYLDGSPLTKLSADADLVCVGAGDGHSGQYVVQVVTGVPFDDHVARPILALAKAGTLHDA